MEQELSLMMLGSLCVSKGRAKREVVPITFLCFFFLKAGTIEPNSCYTPWANAKVQRGCWKQSFFALKGIQQAWNAICLFVFYQKYAQLPCEKIA